MSVVICGGFTLDDTVLVTDEIMRMAPGGNILYAGVGARIWVEDVTLFGVVGHDYPEEYLQILQNKGFDVSYVRRLKTPNIHMWALHEKDNGRQLIYQLKSGHNKDMDPILEDVTSDLLRRASAVHVAAIPIPSQQGLIKTFASSVTNISLDVIHIPGEIDPHDYLNFDMPAGVTAFLPSIEEVHYIWGHDCDLKHVMQSAAQSGIRCTVVKMGKEGVAVYDAASGRYYRIPAYDGVVRDTTGAGDAFCGGFIAGLDSTDDPISAAVMGSVSASFVIANFGAMHALEMDKTEAVRRFDQLYESKEEF